MSNELFSGADEDAYYFSRSNDEEILGTHFDLPFQLDDQSWTTIEHYFQAMKFTNKSYQDKIRAAATPQKARILGRTRFKRIRKDWKEIRATIMTRAIYTLCKTHSNVAQNLMNTGDTKLVENSQYDYYWGCGRDRRGTNMYGQVLMNVRDKLKEESSP